MPFTPQVSSRPRRGRKGVKISLVKIVIRIWSGEISVRCGVTTTSVIVWLDVFYIDWLFASKIAAFLWNCVVEVTSRIPSLTDRVCHQQGLSLWVPFQNAATAVTNIYKGNWTHFHRFYGCKDFRQLFGLDPLHSDCVFTWHALLRQYLVFTVFTQFTSLLFF